MGRGIKVPVITCTCDHVYPTLEGLWGNRREFLSWPLDKGGGGKGEPVYRNRYSDRSSNPGRHKRCLLSPKHCDRFGGPPSLLVSGYRGSLPGG